LTPEQRAAISDAVRRTLELVRRHASERASTPSPSLQTRPETAPQAPGHGSTPDPESLAQRLLSGRPDEFPSDEELRAVIHDPEAGAQLLTLLKQAGVSELGPSPPLNPADCYRERSEPYALRWEIQNPVAREIPFDALDPKTQFFVLFQEWTMREFDGMTSLNRGDTPRAEATFRECVERARQLEVPELEARSYEGLMRAAQKRGDRTAELEWLTQATRARANG
jgi:hypothetical protein